MSTKISTTYSEDAETLAWIDRTRREVSAHKGREVSRSDVIRWLTRAGSATAREELSIVEIAAQV